MTAGKIILSLLICQLITNISFCQDWCDTLIANIKGKRLLSQIRPEIKYMKEKGSYLFSDQEQEFGVKELFNVNDGSALIKTGKEFLVYVIQIYSKNDTIFLVEITIDNISINSNDRRKVIQKYSEVDSTTATSVIDLHNTKYSSWKIADYFYKAWDQSENGDSLSLKEYLHKLIKEKNHNKLVAYASSLDPEQRATGTVGLYFMKLRGERLSKYEEKLIVLNQSSDIMIGGIQNVIEPMRDYLIDEKMSDVLSSVRLEHYYQFFDLF